MVTVSAQTSVSSSPDDARAALGRRESYLCFPGLRPAAGGNGRPAARLAHDIDLPLIAPQEQTATLSLGRAGPRGRRFTVRGALVSIAGRWRLEPLATGVRLHLTLDCEIAPGVKAQAVNELRSRSPLPIRTDADAILSLAVDEFLAARLAEHAAAYCDRVRAQLDRSAS
ncbi:MAG: hypothetical protein L0027_06835 [Candidatus Rokubacteria bacterium]|nr:hypothetical protein [Candidatus Rokubacteria bacterium]